MDKPTQTSLQAIAATWLIPTSMLAFIRHDAPAGWSLLVLAVASGTYAVRSLTPRRDQQHNRS